MWFLTIFSELGSDVLATVNREKRGKTMLPLYQRSPHDERVDLRRQASRREVHSHRQSPAYADVARRNEGTLQSPDFQGSRLMARFRVALASFMSLVPTLYAHARHQGAVPLTATDTSLPGID